MVTQSLKRHNYKLPDKVLFLIFFSFLMIHTVRSQDVQPDWKVFSLGNPMLRIKLPGEATPMEAAVPSELINRLQRFDTYRFYHGDGKLVAVFKFVQYNAPIEGTTTALLEKEVDDLMTSIKAKDVTREEKDFSLQKVPGRKATGSFTLDHHQWLYADLLLRNENSIWQVWIAAEESDPAYAKTMNQIVKGIKF
ncbi:MAG TPA: hypothetical protein VN763_13235 [Saprospiraceae bacterium]|nr:hypothetical protein [Saprospiraceae bacterium]